MTDPVQQVEVDESAVVSGLFGRDMIYLIFWVMQILLAAALTPALTRVMGQRAFGQAAAFVAMAQLLDALFGYSLYVAVQRAYGDKDEEHARHLVALAIGLAVVSGAFAYTTGRWWCPLIGLGPFPVAMRYAVLWATMTAITAPSLALVRSQDNLRAFVAASFAQSIFANGLALALVAFVRATAAEYMLGQLVGEVVAAVIALSIERPMLPSRAHAPRLIQSSRFAVALVPALIAGFVIDTSDRIVIHGDLGPKALSHYVVARNIGGIAGILLAAVSAVWMPRLFAVKDPDARRRVLAESRNGLFVLVLAFVIALSAASPVLLRLWAPPSYQPTTLLLITALIAAGMLPLAAGTVYKQTLILTGRTRAIAAGSVMMAVLNLILNLIFVPIFGIDGSASIAFICYLVGALRLRWMAGDAAPPTSAGRVMFTSAGVAVCVGLAAVPVSGIGAVVRVLVTAAAGLLFLLQITMLIRPALYHRLRKLLVRSLSKPRLG